MYLFPLALVQYNDIRLDLVRKTCKKYSQHSFVDLIFTFVKCRILVALFLAVFSFLPSVPFNIPISLNTPLLSAGSLDASLYFALGMSALLRTVKPLIAGCGLAMVLGTIVAEFFADIKITDISPDDVSRPERAFSRDKGDSILPSNKSYILNGCFIS